MERKIGGECVLYDRKCTGCLECEICDLDPNKVCDNCGKHSPSSDTYNGALDVAKESGWVHIVDGNKDYCPECQFKYEF
jgi:hypothetical protein